MKPTFSESAPDSASSSESAVPDPSDDRPRCLNPDCCQPVERAPQGRPRKYCRDSCRSACRGAGTASSLDTAPDAQLHDAYAREIAQDVRDRGVLLSRLVGRGDDDLILRIVEAHRLARDADDLMAAFIQQARDRKVPMRDTAAALNVSPDTVRRHWPSQRIDDRMRERRRRNQPRPGDRLGQLRPDRGDAGHVTDEDATARFARALSHLQRSSGKPLRGLGKDADVSASYVSRVLSGERCPSWQVAQRLILACCGDPTELRPLWNAARGHGYAAGMVPDAPLLHAVLRGLHLSAARPDPVTICRSTCGRLSPQDVSELLYGPQVPDWPIVDRFVHTVHGNCEAVRPLWDAVRSAVSRTVPLPTISAVPASTTTSPTVSARLSAATYGGGPPYATFS